MACPYFLPQAEMETGPWTHKPRLPLGAAFAGACHAVPGESHQPSPQRQEDLCNCGYARGTCDRFPKDAKADAVRFSVTEDEPNRLSLVYILEKDHAPADFGALEFSVAKQTLLTRPSNRVLAMQVEAFIRNYLGQTRT